MKPVSSETQIEGNRSASVGVLYVMLLCDDFLQIQICSRPQSLTRDVQLVPPSWLQQPKSVPPKRKIKEKTYQPTFMTVTRKSIK